MNKTLRPSSHRLRDLLLEILIAIAIVVGAITYAAYVPPEKWIDFRWVALAGTTAVTFGYPLRWYRRHLNRPLFWGAWVSMLSLHVAIYVVVLLRVSHFGYLWFAIITPAEWTLICPALDRAGRHGTSTV